MSLFERKKQLVQDIAESYSKQIINQNQSSRIIATSFINIVGNNDDSCQKCMLMYMSQDNIDKAFDPTNTDQSYLKLFKQIGNGVCAGLCHIRIEDVEQNNILIYDVTSQINVSLPVPDINEIVNSVIQKTNARYGYLDKTNTSKDNIVSIITMIQQKLSENIKQNISTQQSINVTGGATVKGVTQNLIVNAVMSAIVNSCSEKDNTNCSINLIEEMVQQQIDFIKSEVDKDVIGDFQYVWQQSKLYFIGTGIFLLILFILIVCLLFYKASK